VRTRAEYRRRARIYGWWTRRAMDRAQHVPALIDAVYAHARRAFRLAAKALDTRDHQPGPATRVWVLDRLPLVRVFIHGPRCRRHFQVRRLLLADVDAEAATLHRPGTRLWFVTLEDEVRERACEQLRHDVYAQWADPRERWTR
jgi:hypothetical protein